MSNCYADDRQLGQALKILKGKHRSDGTLVTGQRHPDLEAGASIHLHVKKVKQFTLEEPSKPSKWITLTALRAIKRVQDVG